eukprot:226709-Chlamydomonas_euryale.AAC.6
MALATQMCSSALSGKPVAEPQRVLRLQNDVRKTKPTTPQPAAVLLCGSRGSDMSPSACCGAGSAGAAAAAGSRLRGVPPADDPPNRLSSSTASPVGMRCRMISTSAHPHMLTPAART